MYHHILIAVDLGDEAPQVIARATELARAGLARVTLMHVVEPIGYAYGGDIPLDLSEVTDNLTRSARERLHALARTHCPGAGVEVRIGRPATEVHALAREQNVDLIVVGSHGRSGLQLLLGSTANSVLHGARCDVLAVRVREPE